MAWIRLIRSNGCISASGARACWAGHRIPLTDGELDGVYAGWHWDEQARTLRIDTDRLGFYPLFAWAGRDTCVLAQNLDEVLEAGAPAAFDDDALAVFLRVGFFLDDDTPFRAVRTVPPSAELRWTSGRAELVGRRVPPRAPLTIARDEAIDAFIARFRSAIERRLLAGPFQLPLSGGRDSRHILFALVDAGRPPEACVTVEPFPPHGRDDVVVAAALCRELGIPHIVLRQPADRVRLEREKNARTHQCSDEHVQFTVLADHLRAQSPATYDGIAGDVLSQSARLSPDLLRLFDRGDGEAIAAHVLARPDVVSEAALDRLLLPSLRRRLTRERAIARLAAELRRHLDAPNPIASFYFWNRTRREIALSPYALMRDIPVLAPFLDRDVFALLAALPVSLQMDRQLHTDAITRAYPSHAGIPYAVRTHRRGAGSHRAALGLARALVRAPALVRSAALLPAVASAVLTGDARRLWPLTHAVQLDQLAAMASRRAR